MPEQHGISRNIILPRFFSLEPFDSRIEVGDERRNIVICHRDIEKIFTYLQEERDALAAAYDELARYANELPEEVSFSFYQNNVPANQTNVTLLGPPSTRGYPLSDWGSVVRIVVTSDAARTAGSLTVEPLIISASAGTTTATGLTAVLDGTNTRTKMTLQNAGLNRSNAGDLLGCRITSASWAPTTANIDVAVGLKYQTRTR